MFLGLGQKIFDVYTEYKRIRKEISPNIKASPEKKPYSPKKWVT